MGNKISKSNRHCLKAHPGQRTGMGGGGGEIGGRKRWMDNKKGLVHPILKRKSVNQGIS